MLFRRSAQVTANNTLTLAAVELFPCFIYNSPLRSFMCPMFCHCCFLTFYSIFCLCKRSRTVSSSLNFPPDTINVQLIRFTPLYGTQFATSHVPTFSPCTQKATKRGVSLLSLLSALVESTFELRFL